MADVYDVKGGGGERGVVVLDSEYSSESVKRKFRNWTVNNFRRKF